MVSHMQPPDETQKRQKNKILLYSYVLESEGRACQAGLHEEAPVSVRRKKGHQLGESLGHGLYWILCRKGVAE